jgi:hypothetical protein
MRSGYLVGADAQRQFYFGVQRRPVTDTQGLCMPDGDDMELEKGSAQM